MLAATLLAILLAVQAPRREIVITFDDLPFVSERALPLDTLDARSRRLIGSLTAHRVPAIGFVNEQKVYDADRNPDPRRVRLLEFWLEAGLALGNHTYSHPDLHRITLQEYERDLLRGEMILRPLLLERGEQPRYFRHPFLHTGRNLAVRDSLLQFLAGHGYAVAPVTIDNADYLFARAHDRAVLRGDAATASRIAATYLDYMDSVVTFYEGQAQAILGRDFPQILLLHANSLNTRTFDALASRLTQRGYQFITLELALRDPAYQSEDRFTGEGGISWLHRWGITRQLPGSTYRGEPTVPAWVDSLANRAD